MESAESFCEKYFPNSSVRDIYSLDEFIDPSRVGDQELVSNLTSISHMGKEEMEVYRLDNPSVRLDNPSKLLLLMKEAVEAAVKNMSTAYGEWSYKTMSAIPNTSQGNSSNSPKFVGTKTTMEFKPTDGTKLVVGMTRYNLLTTRENSDGLYLEEDLALCHIYPLEGKNKADRKRNITSERFEDFDPPKLNRPEQVMSKLDFQNMHPIGTGDYRIDDLVPSKRPRSDHWDSFTKIYTKNENLMYAACNHCNTMLKLKSKRGAASNCGTNSLKNHSKTKTCTQKQLSGSSSTIIEHGVVEI